MQKALSILIFTFILKNSLCSVGKSCPGGASDCTALTGTICKDGTCQCDVNKYEAASKLSCVDANSVALGDPCINDEVCPQNAECPTGDNRVCTCKAAYWKDGASCAARIAPDETCTDDGSCVTNATCKDAAGGAKKCTCDDGYMKSDKTCASKPKTKPGESCDATDDCVENATCSGEEGKKTCNCNKDFSATTEGTCKASPNSYSGISNVLLTYLSVAFCAFLYW